MSINFDEAVALKDAIAPLVRVAQDAITVDRANDTYSIQIRMPKDYTRTLLQKLTEQIHDMFSAYHDVYIEFFHESKRLYAAAWDADNELVEYINFNEEGGD